MSALKRFRMAKGMNSTDLARAMGVTPGAVYAWESGRFMPKPKYIPKLARVLGIESFALTRLIVPDEQPGEANLTTSAK